MFDGFEGLFDLFLQRFGGFLLHKFDEPAVLLHHIQRERAVAIGVTGLQKQTVDSDSGKPHLSTDAKRAQRLSSLWNFFGTKGDAEEKQRSPPTER
jgi:hypothetical protein